MTSLVATIAAGLFVMSAIDRGRDLFRQAGTAQADPHAHGRRSFTRWEPLQLAPYTMPWPSEMKHKRHPLPPLYWPSDKWDDPQFGPVAKRRPVSHQTSLTGNQPLEATMPVRQASVREPTPEPVESGAEAAFFDTTAAKTQRPHLSQQEQNLNSRMALVALEQAKRQKQATATPAPRTRSRPAPKKAPKPSSARQAPAVDSGLPDAETLAGWVDEVGLAGAVSRLRSQTGWDFQRAARHLAQQVSGGRK